MDCCTTRTLINGLRVQLKLADGTVAESVTIGSNNTVVVRNFTTPFNPPFYPDPNSPSQLALRETGVRYIRITNPSNYINLREMIVLDQNLVNGESLVPC